MLVILGILSAGVLGVIIYFVISPKSSKMLKLTALIALGVTCLTLGICVVILLRGSGKAEETIPFHLFSDVPPPANLIMNPGFENGAGNWGEGNAVLEIDAFFGNAHSGTKSLKLSNSTLAYSYAKQTVKVKPDTEYIFTFWGRSNGMNNSVWLHGVLQS